MSMPEPIDPMEAIRRNPQWVFPRRVFESETVVGLLVAEASSSPAVRSVQVHHVEGWWAVRADGDWLDGDLTPFSSFSPFPEAGANETRVEAVLVAFCPHVVTALDGVEQPLTSRGAPPSTIEELLNRPGAARTVVFMAPPSNGGHQELHRPADLLWDLWVGLPDREREFNHV